MKNMLILSSLFFNRVGNQSLLETVREYSNYYRIFLITSSSESETYYKSIVESKKLLNDNVFIYRSPQIFHKFFRLAAQISKNFKSSKLDESESKIDNSFVNLKYTFWNIMSFRVSNFILFLYTLSLIVSRRIPSPNVLCAYEIGGVVPVLSLKRIFGKSKTLAKMQGTVLYQSILNDNLNDKSVALDVLIYKKLINFDLVSMTNDGTFGDYVLDYFGVKANRYVFLTNGISKYIIGKKAELTLEFSNTKDEIYLTSISRLIGWKRVYLSIELMNLLVNIHGNRKFRLNIYGFGNLNEVNYLNSIIDKYNLKDYVMLNGEVAYEEVPEIFMNSDFLLSLYKMTNVTNPLLEAVFLNLPIISIFDINLGKVISNDPNHNIFLFNETNTEFDLIEDIAAFLNNCDIKTVRDTRKGLFDSDVSIVNSWEERVKIEVSRLEAIGR